MKTIFFLSNSKYGELVRVLSERSWVQTRLLVVAIELGYPRNPGTKKKNYVLIYLIMFCIGITTFGLTHPISCDSNANVFLWRKNIFLKHSFSIAVKKSSLPIFDPSYVIISINLCPIFFCSNSVVSKPFPSSLRNLTVVIMSLIYLY